MLHSQPEVQGQLLLALPRPGALLAPPGAEKRHPLKGWLRAAGPGASTNADILAKERFDILQKRRVQQPNLEHKQGLDSAQPSKKFLEVNVWEKNAHIVN